jgi:hypothetical protein
MRSESLDHFLKASSETAGVLLVLRFLVKEVQ